MGSRVQPHGWGSSLSFTLLSSMTWSESPNFSEQHLSASPQNGRIAQAHNPSHSQTQKLGTKTHLPANATWSDILCKIFTLHTFHCGVWGGVAPDNRREQRASIPKTPTSEFQITAGPQGFRLETVVLSQLHHRLVRTKCDSA